MPITEHPPLGASATTPMQPFDPHRHPNLLDTT